MSAELNKLADYFASKGPQFSELEGATRLIAREAERLGAHELPDNQRIPSLTGERVSQSRIEISLSSETQELIEQLRRDGYFVYYTAGKSPAVARAEGMRFLYVAPALEHASTVKALVAFRPNPEDFFLRGSQSLPHEKQLELLEAEKSRVEKQYPDSGLIVREGEAPEWPEISWKHFLKTGVRLFGRDYDYGYTQTDTCKDDQPGAERAAVGRWSEEDGLFVDFAHPDAVDPRLRLAPLVEIPRK